jgi:hypothetical protein
MAPYCSISDIDIPCAQGEQFSLPCAYILICTVHTV